MTHFQDIKTLPSEQDRLDYWLEGILAIDLETQARLTASHARRRAGKPKHYYVEAPASTLHTRYFQRSVSPDNPSGATQVEGYRKVFGLSAFSLGKAIEKANQMFPKKYAKFRQGLEAKQG